MTQRFSAWFLVAALVVPVASDAVSIRRQCRQSCGPSIDACVSAGGHRRRCKRQVLKRCRQQGLATCTGATTTTTLAGGPTTTTMPGGAVNGCTLATATDRRGETAVVTYTLPAYTPPCIRIASGESVTFAGAGGATFTLHPLRGGTVTGSGASAVKTPDPSSPIPSPNAGTMLVVPFPNAGTFPFYCDLHYNLGMVGAIFVEP